MATPWDRAAAKYIEEWVPRFVPYHVDLVRELALAQGQRVLVVSSGPGSEVLAVARAVGTNGFVRATDRNEALVKVCCAQLEKAGFSAVQCERAEPTDVGDGEWNAIVCAFGLWPLENREAVLSRWASALAPNGKVGVLTFGPPTDDDPFEMLARALKELEPTAVHRPTAIDASREAMTKMFESAGLSLVRHTLLRHTITFESAEAFVDAIKQGRTWGRVWDELGDLGADVDLSPGLRGHDAVQLASALTWQESAGEEIVLATFDQQLWEAAKRTGLKAWPDKLPGATSQPEEPRHQEEG